MARPSIADLEAILQREDEVEIEILPNGEVRAKNQTTPTERGGRKAADDARRPGRRIRGVGVMTLQRLQADIGLAAEHFPNVETYTTTDGGLYIKAALQTSVGQMYIIMVTFAGYPSSMPKVTVITPAVKQRHAHVYRRSYLLHASERMESRPSRPQICPGSDGSLAQQA